MPLREHIKLAVEGTDLSRAQAAAAMDAMLDELDATLATHEGWSRAAREAESAAEARLLARAGELVSD